ncbi:response regulator transcription factor [Pedobacter xixiisoli]|uniref:Response regulator receiver domain-containing protein n=1 Tax=Pedobacter xixiisoli TaxID=1476464 RepID=A0A285ZWE3_9SPHI|nr:response regulator [Pedobacter xixiisoli]SOD13962.1 Response regulator receiver domain-containing protein [Pedobacter xixiisoli]
MKREITILEDDQDIREIFTYLFTSEGYKVNAFGSVSAFEDHQSHPDIFLLDVMLPDGSGLDVCKNLKADLGYASIPVIMMSAHLEKVNMIKSCKAEEFLEKPFDINLLLYHVDKLIK